METTKRPVQHDGKGPHNKPLKHRGAGDPDGAKHHIVVNTVEDAVLVMKLPGDQVLGEGGQVIDRKGEGEVRGGVRPCSSPTTPAPGKTTLISDGLAEWGGWGWGHLNLGWRCRTHHTTEFFFV